MPKPTTWCGFSQIKSTYNCFYVLFNVCHVLWKNCMWRLFSITLTEEINSRLSWIFGLSPTFSLTGRLVFVETSLICQNSHNFILTFIGVNFLAALVGLVGCENLFCKPRFLIRISGKCTWFSFAIFVIPLRVKAWKTSLASLLFLCHVLGVNEV